MFSSTKQMVAPHDVVSELFERISQEERLVYKC